MADVLRRYHLLLSFLLEFVLLMYPAPIPSSGYCCVERLWPLRHSLRLEFLFHGRVRVNLTDELA